LRRGFIVIAHDLERLRQTQKVSANHSLFIFQLLACRRHQSLPSNSRGKVGIFRWQLYQEGKLFF